VDEELVERQLLQGFSGSSSGLEECKRDPMHDDCNKYLK
jgi:hypothetical protein